MSYFFILIPLWKYSFFIYKRILKASFKQPKTSLKLGHSEAWKLLKVPGDRAIFFNPLVPFNIVAKRFWSALNNNHLAANQRGVRSIRVKHPANIELRSLSEKHELTARRVEHRKVPPGGIEHKQLVFHRHQPITS